MLFFSRIYIVLVNLENQIRQGFGQYIVIRTKTLVMKTIFFLSLLHKFELT